MKNLEVYRKSWNTQQKQLRQSLENPHRYMEAIDLFLGQHAMLHAAQVAETGTFSFEDALLNDMSEGQIRRIPHNCEHSVAWLLWHMARIEDATMNLLVAGTPQILHTADWLKRMKMQVQNSGNGMSETAVLHLSTTINIDALRAYRVEVGRRTRAIVYQLEPETFKQKVDPVRLQKIMDEGVLLEEAVGIKNYWGRRNIAGLLLMPPTRHNFVHLNEAFRLKQRRQ